MIPSSSLSLSLYAHFSPPHFQDIHILDFLGNINLFSFWIEQGTGIHLWEWTSRVQSALSSFLIRTTVVRLGNGAVVSSGDQINV